MLDRTGWCDRIGIFGIRVVAFATLIHMPVGARPRRPPALA